MLQLPHRYLVRHMILTFSSTWKIYLELRTWDMHYHRPTLFGRKRLSVFIQHVRLTHIFMDGLGTGVGMG